jgi:isochorismate synthase
MVPRAALAAIAVDLRAAPRDTLRVAHAEVDLDPLEVVRAGQAAFGEAVFYTDPDGRSIGGLGAARRIVAAGPERFFRLDGALAGLPSGTPAMVGYAFSADGATSEEWDGFPSAEVVIPQIAVIREAGASRLVVTVPPGSDPAGALAAAATLRMPAEPELLEPGAFAVVPEPEPEDWREQVEEALASIAAGGLDKVVLARSLVVRRGTPIPAFDLVALLRDRHPRCRAFGWQAGDAAFVGASPELLVRRSGRRFETIPLAGSAPRGSDPAEDRRIGDALLASAKDRGEHSLVIDDVVRRLLPFSEVLDVAPGPRLERFSTVQHLSTAVSGTSSSRLLTLVDALHPTPAVGGTPSAEALAFIRKVEEIDRGWYAGGIGWLDPSGDGEVSVGLRCALVRDDTARIYAGNGIVAGSDPDAEVAETRLKLRPLLELLTGS